MRIKTDAAKGAAEYKPKKTINFAENISTKAPSDWEQTYREELVQRIKVFKPVSVKSFFNGIYTEFIKFNADLEKPEWFWNDETIDGAGVWTLRDIAVQLENAKKKS